MIIVDYVSLWMLLLCCVQGITLVSFLWAEVCDQKIAVLLEPFPLPSRFSETAITPWYEVVGITTSLPTEDTKEIEHGGFSTEIVFSERWPP